ncbi:DUF2512 family protein [Bacillus niameyensis]|uniref:DUF2512 family protein n=1 Tax=Bacillus niameyensis TaxID=1522308 RepID=UPI0007844B79|nr:DUF2512 family protein [Bacillus niameyensis]
MNIVIKLVVCTLTVVLASALLTNVHFPYFYQSLVTGVTLAVAGYLTEKALLRRETFWLTTATDFVVTAIFVYIFAYFFSGAYITVVGAILIAAFLTVIEFFVHLWLLSTGRTVKSS